MYSRMWNDVNEPSFINPNKLNTCCTASTQYSFKNYQLYSEQKFSTSSIINHENWKKINKSSFDSITHLPQTTYVIIVDFMTVVIKISELFGIDQTNFTNIIKRICLVQILVSLILNWIQLTVIQISNCFSVGFFVLLELKDIITDLNWLDSVSVFNQNGWPYNRFNIFGIFEVFASG